ncbi:MAG: hypothetical protein QM650_02760 [Microlunatus sp.]
MTSTDPIAARLLAANAALDELEAAILAADSAGWSRHKTAEYLGTYDHQVERWLRNRGRRRRFNQQTTGVAFEPEWP